MARRSTAQEKLKENKKVIKQLYELLLYPAIKSTPEGYDWREWLDYLWGVNSRFISRFNVIADTYINGKFKESDDLPTKFCLRKGTQLFVRVDADDPTVVHVEVTSGKSNKGEWFLTSRYEWKKALRNTVHKPFRNTNKANVEWDVTQFY